MPGDFMAELKAIAGPLTSSDRRILANAAMKAAIECVQARDYGAAQFCIEAAQAHVRVLRGMTEGGE